MSNGAPSPGIVRSQTVHGFRLGRPGAERVSVLPKVCAISVVSFADALGLKYICAPLASVLFLGLLIGRLLPIKELSFKPLKCRPCA